jgi:hypothetical protein
MIKKIPFMLRLSKHSVSFFSNLPAIGEPWVELDAPMDGSLS